MAYKAPAPRLTASGATNDLQETEISPLGGWRDPRANTDCAVECPFSLEGGHDTPAHSEPGVPVPAELRWNGRGHERGRGQIGAGLRAESPPPRGVEEGRWSERCSLGVLERKGGAVPVGESRGRAASRGASASLEKAGGTVL